MTNHVAVPEEDQPTHTQDDHPTPAIGTALRSVPPGTEGDAGRASAGWLPRAVVAWHGRGRRARTELADAGMATAEYAIATLAAVGFAGLLVVILKGNEVKGLLLGIIRQALSL